MEHFVMFVVHVVQPLVIYDTSCVSHAVTNMWRHSGGVVIKAIFYVISVTLSNATFVASVNYGQFQCNLDAIFAAIPQTSPPSFEHLRNLSNSAAIN